MTKLCPVCNTYESRTDRTIGILPCIKCTERRAMEKSSSSVVEFTSLSIKEDRKKYEKDILQPFRAGELSKEYVECYGSRGIGLSKEELKKSS